MEPGWSTGREVEIYKEQGAGPCGSHLGLPSRADPSGAPPSPGGWRQGPSSGAGNSHLSWQPGAFPGQEPKGP